VIGTKKTAALDVMLEVLASAGSIPTCDACAWRALTAVLQASVSTACTWRLVDTRPPEIKHPISVGMSPKLDPRTLKYCSYVRTCWDVHLTGFIFPASSTPTIIGDIQDLHTPYIVLSRHA
jgi:hypothetical protein